MQSDFPIWGLGISVMLALLGFLIWAMSVAVTHNKQARGWCETHNLGTVILRDGVFCFDSESRHVFLPPRQSKAAAVNDRQITE